VNTHDTPHRNYVLIGDGYELELRDLFAGLIIPTFSRQPMTPDNAARQAYLYADAMLKVRIADGPQETK
jgi:hypothetical protein